jgi:lipoyl(octanoyl) transferase
MKQKLIVEDLGHMGYQQAWDYQEELLKKNVEAKRLISDKNRALHVAGTGNDAGTHLNDITTFSEDANDSTTTKHYLLFVEHPPVYTLGKSGKEEHVLIGEEERRLRGIEYIKTNRGGDITFHGPEQIVGYPILDLEKFYTDIGKYLRNLEEVIILTMADYGLKGERSTGETGVWLDPDVKGKERKICAMGVRCSRWVTMHGFAFNINTNLSYFDYIVPCGIQNKQVTSLEKELGRKIPLQEVKERLLKNFEKVFEVEGVNGEW